MDFSVFYREKVCGIVSACDDDMFVVLTANCDIISLNISRIFLKSDDIEINLGVLMPKNGRYVLKKRIPKSYAKKIKLNENFKACIVCENENNIPTIISDKNLEKCVSKCTKTEISEHFHMYSFKFSENMPFIFDFCISMCHFSENTIMIKTDKFGKILPW